MLLLENLIVRGFSLSIGAGIFYKVVYPILQNAVESANTISQILTTL